MPHKHTRKAVNRTDFDLAPSVVAKPLPAFDRASSTKDRKRTQDAKQKNRPAKRQKTSSGYGPDDTPRAFARMMELQSGKRPYKSLDDGEARRAKQSKNKSKPSEEKAVQPSSMDAAELPTKAIQRLPGESLRDFSARVDQALPLSGLATKGKKVAGIKERQTKIEKRLHKMYAEWRVEEAKIKAREEEAAEKAEEDEEDRMAEFGGQDIRLPESKRAKKRRAIGEVGLMEEDPWAVLKSKREAPKGLHDVAQAPPEFSVVPKEKFNVRNGAKVSVANVPLSSGSLKKREELGEARREVIERYRAMMRSNNR